MGLSGPIIFIFEKGLQVLGAHEVCSSRIIRPGEKNMQDDRMYLLNLVDLLAHQISFLSWFSFPWAKSFHMSVDLTTAVCVSRFDPLELYNRGCLEKIKVQ